LTDIERILQLYCKLLAGQYIAQTTVNDQKFKVMFAGIAKIFTDHNIKNSLSHC